MAALTRLFPAFALLGLLLLTRTAIAQEAPEAELTEEEMAFVAAAQEFLESLDKQHGDIALGQDLATLSVPDDYYFLGAADARRVLVDVWGNPPQNGDVLGMLFPAKYTPFDEESWAVTIEYVEDGYVSDEDAAGIDYGDLLRDMQKDTRSANKARVEAGYEEIELVGWAEAPHYDARSKKLYWAKELRFGEGDATILNYDIRALGRKGILSMTFIAATDQLAEINSARESVLAMAEFNEGMRYEDFDSSIDKVAAYGIGALVAGKVAAKAGLFGAALLFLKKFGIFIVLGIAALGRRLFGGGKKSVDQGQEN